MISCSTMIKIDDSNRLRSVNRLEYGEAKGEAGGGMCACFPYSCP